MNTEDFVTYENNEANVEIWKDIPGYEGLYQVSNLGRVRSLDRLTPMPNGKLRRECGRVMYQSTTRCGYYVIGLSKGDKRKYFSVHRLVAMAFIHNPDNLRCVNHKDENKMNNHLDNLEWCSSSYNNQYGSRLERVSKAIGRKVVQLDEHGNVIGVFNSIKEAYRKTGINSSSINAVCSGFRNRHTAGGYKWKYYEKD